MGIIPDKPHFFKPILPGFKHGITIPESFFRYLKGKKIITKEAVLKRGGKKWRVEIINERSFRDSNNDNGGWRRFTEENDLQVGDFVVFRHEGDMVFEVLVFDPSGCEREFPVPDDVGADEVKIVKSEVSLEILEPKGSGEIRKDEQTLKGFDDIAASRRPKVVITITPSCIRHRKLIIPLGFARVNGLCRRRCEMSLKDSGGRMWHVGLRYSAGCNPYIIGDGLAKFCEENDLRVGDQVEFELIESGAIPVMQFHVVEISEQELKPSNDPTGVERVSLLHGGSDANRNQLMTDDLKGKCTDSSVIDGMDEVKPLTNPTAKTSSPFFVLRLKHHNSKSRFLNIPTEFAETTGLSSRGQCKMVLIDPKRRSWSADIQRKSTNNVGITLGWLSFLITNNLKEGDLIKLELVQAGELPIMNFQKLKGGPKMTNPRETATCSLSGDHPYFLSTIRPYSTKRSVLHLPIEFLRKNGLIVDRGVMILIDDLQRSWKVELRRDSKQISIVKGWLSFCRANGFGAGDSYKFELIKTGKTPVANFTSVSGRSSEHKTED